MGTTLDPLTALAVLAMGAILGFAGGLLGVGGGIVAIPVLIALCGFDQATAQGTALVTMAPNLLIAWWRHARCCGTPWRDVLAVALAGSLATGLAASVAHALDPRLLRLAFALFLLALAARSLARTPPPGDRVHRRWLPLAGAAGGACMGLLGVGAGLVATPLFVRLFGFDQRAAQALGLAVVAPGATVALAAYGVHRHVDWPLGALLAAGGAATVALGVRLAHHWPERRLRAAFAAVLALTGVWLLGSA
jgi:uncharacterized protein